MDSLLILAGSTTDGFKLLLDDNKLAAIYNMLHPLIKTFQPIAFFGFILVIFQEYSRMTIGGERMDILRIGRYLLMFVLFLNYSEVVTWTNHMSNAILDSYKMHQDMQTQAYVAAKSNQALANIVMSDGFVQVLSVVNSGIITDIIKWVMLALRDYMVMFLMATGPITFAISLIPGFGEGLMKKWFSYYIGVLLWGMTYFILYNMSEIMNLKVLAESSVSGGGSGGMGDITMGLIQNIPTQLGIAIMYIMAPWLTSKLMQGNPSSIASRMFGTATAAAGIAAKAGSMMVSAGGGATGAASGGGGGVMQAASGGSSGGGSGGGSAYNKTSSNSLSTASSGAGNYNNVNKTKE